MQIIFAILIVIRLFFFCEKSQCHLFKKRIMQNSNPIQILLLFR